MILIKRSESKFASLKTFFYLSQPNFVTQISTHDKVVKQKGIIVADPASTFPPFIESKLEIDSLLSFKFFKFLFFIIN